MKVLFLATILALVAPQALPQSENGIVEGTLRHARTSDPIKNTIITLSPGGVPARAAAAAPLTAKTNDQGRFLFGNVPPGQYAFALPPDGYMRPLRGGGVRTVTVARGQEIRDITLAWIEGAAISGRVLEDDGRPARGAIVSVLELGYRYGKRILNSPDAVVSAIGTDDRGGFSLFSLRPGTYYLRVTYDPQDIRYIYYPGSFHATSAAPIVVTEGADTTISDFRLPPRSDAGVKVSGKVVDESGAPINAFVSGLRLRPHEYDELAVFGFAINYGNLIGSAAKERLEGGFELRGVRPGVYDLLVELRGAGRGTPPTGPLRWSRTLIVVKDEDIKDLTVVLMPGVEIKGSVGVEGDRSLVPMGSLSVELGTDDGTLVRRAPATDGTFLLDNLPEGQYRIAVGGLPGGTYVADIQQEAKSVYDSGIMVTRTSAPLQVILNTAGGSVEGIVQDAARKPVNEATVALAPAPARRQNLNLYKSAGTDAQGRFTLTGIAPGAYKLFAWEDIPEGAFQNAEFLGRYEAQGVNVTVNASGRGNVMLSVLPGF